MKEINEIPTEEFETTKCSWQEMTDAAHRSISPLARKAAEILLISIILAEVIPEIIELEFAQVKSIPAFIMMIGLYGMGKYLLWAALPNTRPTRRVGSVIAAFAAVIKYDVLFGWGSIELLFHIIFIIAAISTVFAALLHLLCFLAEHAEGGGNPAGIE